MTTPARTDRLVLRQWRRSDATALLSIRASPDVARGMVDTTPWSRIDQAHEAIDRWMQQAADDTGLGCWAVVLPGDDTPIGTLSLQRIPGADGEVEVGWTLHPDAWGNGYAREAAGRVLEHATNLGLDRVWALMWPDNTASARVCRAIGMTDLGVHPDPWYGGDSHMFRVDLGRPGSSRAADRG